MKQIAFFRVCSIVWISLWALGGASPCIGQTLPDMLSSMATTLGEAEHLVLTVDGRLEYQQESQGEETFEALMIRSGNDLYSKSPGIEIIAMDSVMLTLDHDAKRMFIDRYQAQQIQELSDVQLLQLKQQLQATLDSSQWDISQEGNGNWLLQHGAVGAPYQQMLMELDGDSFLPTRYELYYDPQFETPYFRMVALYDFHISATKAKQALKKIRMDTYLANWKSPDGPKPAPAFSDYQIVNRFELSPTP